MRSLKLQFLAVSRKKQNFPENPGFSNFENFAHTWSYTMFLGTTSTYSSRSVDSRGFFCFSMMVGYPYLVPDLEENYKNQHIWEFQEKISKILSFSGENIFEIFRTWLRGYIKFWKIKKNSRKSTDLDEYMLFKKNLIKKY